MGGISGGWEFPKIKAVHGKQQGRSTLWGAHLGFRYPAIQCGRRRPPATDGLGVPPLPTHTQVTGHATVTVGGTGRLVAQVKEGKGRERAGEPSRRTSFRLVSTFARTHKATHRACGKPSGYTSEEKATARGGFPGNGERARNLFGRTQAGSAGAQRTPERTWDVTGDVTDR